MATKTEYLLSELRCASLRARWPEPPNCQENGVGIPVNSTVMFSVHAVKTSPPGSISLNLRIRRRQWNQRLKKRPKKLRIRVSTT